MPSSDRLEMPLHLTCLLSQVCVPQTKPLNFVYIQTLTTLSFTSLSSKLWLKSSSLRSCLFPPQSQQYPLSFNSKHLLDQSHRSRLAKDKEATFHRHTTSMSYRISLRLSQATHTHNNVSSFSNPICQFIWTTPYEITLKNLMNPRKIHPNSSIIPHSFLI